MLLRLESRSFSLRSAVLIRLGLAGLPLLLGLLAVNYFTDEMYRSFYQTLSVAITVAAVFRFGADLGLKRGVPLTFASNATQLADAPIVVVNITIISLVLILFFIWTGFLQGLFAGLIFFIYFFFTLFALHLRLNARVWCALVYEPVFVYLPFIMFIPFYIFFPAYYLAMVCICLSIYVVFGLVFFGGKKITLVPDFDALKYQGRLHEGFFGVISVCFGSLSLYYFSSQESAKESLLAYQLTLILATIRSVELNWFFRERMVFIEGVLESRRLVEFSHLILTRLIQAAFVAIAIYLPVIWFGIDVDKYVLVCFLVFEVICFVSSPFVAFFQRNEPMRVNLILGFTYLLVVLVYLYGPEFIYVVPLLIIILLVRVFYLLRLIVGDHAKSSA